MTPAPRPPQAVPQASLDALLKLHNQDIADAYARGVQEGAVAMFCGFVVLGLLVTALWGMGL